jgi:hypothetical protein
MYEQIIRVTTAFFSALIGFGLKHLLDIRPEDAGDFARDQWPCFILAVLLFLRFLLGSANHLWFEYVRKPPQRVHPGLLVWDLTFVILFGILASVICYSNTVIQFLFWSLTLLGVAIFWNIFDPFVRWLVDLRAAGNWTGPWLGINALQAISIGVAQCFHGCIIKVVPSLESSWSVTVLVPIFAVCLLYDVIHQLTVL